MQENNEILERQIRKRFDQISAKRWFSEDIETDNFQLMELYDFFGDLENKKILDIGCAKGRFVKRVVEKGALVTGVDLSEQLINEARKNVPHAQFLVGSATKLPFNDELFDCIYSIETFEHIPDTEKGVREACRVLKKGGKIIVIDKHILGLNPNFLVPNFIRKPILEKCNKWMYPKNFPFKEKYFVKNDLDKYLNLYCSRCFTHYMKTFGIGPKTRLMLDKYPTLTKLKLSVTKKIYETFSFLSFYISWRWEK